MERFCPSCHQKLGLSDYYFCSWCGGNLDSENILDTGSFKVVSDLGKKYVREKIRVRLFLEPIKNALVRINIKQIAIILVTLVLVGLPMYGYLSGANTYLLSMLPINYPVSTSKPIDKSLVVSDSTEGVLVSDVVAKSGTLGQNMGIKLVPYNTDIYYEITDFGVASNLFLVKEPYFVDLVNTLKNFSSGHVFGFIQNTEAGYNWCVIVPMKEVPGTSDNSVFEDTKAKYPWLKIEVIANNLVVTNDDKLVNQVTELNSGLAKNLSMNPTYATTKSKIDKNGKALVVVLTGEGKAILQDYLTKENPTEFDSVVKILLQSQVNYLVVK